MSPDTPAVAGLLLAGGLSRRMGGGDKALRTLGGETLLARVLQRIRPQVRRVVLNANGDPARFQAYGLPIVPDSVPDFAGPLAGVLAGLEWAKTQATDLPWVASFATDAPFVPRDLVARFLEAVKTGQAQLACAASGGRTHPVFGLWPVSLADDLRHAIVDEGLRKVEDWTGRFKVAVVEYPASPFDPFFNANRPEDLAQAEQLLTSATAVS
jgi:molybdopterin-guanine dinucleotide biosynthesis protein A